MNKDSLDMIRSFMITFYRSFSLFVKCLIEKPDFYSIE